MSIPTKSIMPIVIMETARSISVAFFQSDFLGFMPNRNAPIPSMKSTLTTLDPNTLPTAIPLWPSAEAMMDTTSSGNEVDVESRRNPTAACPMLK